MTPYPSEGTRSYENQGRNAIKSAKMLKFYWVLCFISLINLFLPLWVLWFNFSFIQTREVFSHKGQSGSTQIHVVLLWSNWGRHKLNSDVFCLSFWIYHLENESFRLSLCYVCIGDIASNVFNKKGIHRSVVNRSLKNQLIENGFLQYMNRNNTSLFRKWPVEKVIQS